MAWLRVVGASMLGLMLLAPPGWAQLHTTISPALPNLNTEEAPKSGDKGANEPTYCRPPSQRPDSRLPGPQVCMTVRKWNDLHAAGLDIGPDGTSVVPLTRHLRVLGR